MENTEILLRFFIHDKSQSKITFASHCIALNSVPVQHHLIPHYQSKMKVSIAISAKALSSGAGEYYAVVTRDGDEIGKTNVEHDTADPTWTKSILLECGEESPSGTLGIQIANVVGKQEDPLEFDLAKIWDADNKAMAKAMDNAGGIIAVHVEEQVVTGSLQIQIHGNQLQNLDGRFGRIAIRKSDPFYEVKNKQGDTVYKSEVIQNDLHPQWEESAEMDISLLCGGDFSQSIQFIVQDQDDEGEYELMGVTSTTVQELMEGKRVLYLAYNDEVCGQLLVDSVQLLNADNASPAALEQLEIVGQTLLKHAQLDTAKNMAESKALAATEAQEHAAALVQVAETKQTEADNAAQDVVDIQAKVEELKQTAAEAKELSKTQRCSGTLELQLSGQDLPDTDGWRNMTDPYFEVYGFKGDIVYKSEVINDCVDPEWQMASMDVNALTNGNLDMKIRITFSDSDADEKSDYLGQILVSVNSLENGQELDLQKGLHSTGKGQIKINKVDLKDFEDLREKAKKLKEEAEEVRMSSYETGRVSKAKFEEAQNATMEAKQAQHDATVAEEEATKASKTVEELMAALEL